MKSNRAIAPLGVTAGIAEGGVAHALMRAIARGAREAETPTLRSSQIPLEP